MGLIFYHRSNKTKRNLVYNTSKTRDVKELTPSNKEFLRSLNYKVIGNEDVKHTKREK